MVLERWISEPYLNGRKVQALIESAKIKPVARYLVLDDFFRVDALEQLREHCSKLQYSDDDRHADGVRLLPYDSAVKFADASDIGWDLFSAQEWHTYCANLVGVTLSEPRQSMVKLRYHRPNATGFWIHTDAIPGKRSMSLIAYFNRDWRTQDGALLQLWRDDAPNAAFDVPTIDTPDPERSLEVLQTAERIRTRTPGGGRVSGPRDFTLVDQIVPEYNRLVVCNLQSSPAWHSVTPSRDRSRHGFVQWIA